MKKILFLMFVQLSSIYLFAQSADVLRYETNKHNPYALSDSINISASIYNSNSSVNPYLVGAIVGGSTIVLTSIPFLVANVNYDLPWIPLPLIAGGVTFLAGALIASLNNSNIADGNPSSMRLFNNYGVLTSFSTQLDTKALNTDVSFGFTYRILDNKFYLPSKFSLLYGMGYRKYYTDEYYGVDGTETKFGIETIFIDYSKIFSFLYGFEGGLQLLNGNYSVYNANNNQEEITIRREISPYLNLIAGLNVNYSGWLSWEFLYKYALYNVGDKMESEGINILMKRHFLSTTVAIYF